MTNIHEILKGYGKVIENISKETISGVLKNTDLSGTPSAGTVEAKRFVNAASKDYGTARVQSHAKFREIKKVEL